MDEGFGTRRVIMKKNRACGGLFVVISFKRFIHKKIYIFLRFKYAFGKREGGGI